MNILKVKCWILSICSLGAVAMTSCDKSSSSGEDVIEKNKITKEFGEKFLADNRGNDGVVETDTGLQYKIDSLGKGEKPILTDSVTLTFVGKLPTGETFVSNTERLLVSSQIEGLKQGLRYMPEGSVFTLYIPYYLAYNVNGRTFKYQGKTVSVDAYSVVIFDCKLESVKHNQD